MVLLPDLSCSCKTMVRGDVQVDLINDPIKGLKVCASGGMLPFSYIAITTKQV